MMVKDMLLQTREEECPKSPESWASFIPTPLIHSSAEGEGFVKHVEGRKSMIKSLKYVFSTSETSS